MHVQPQEPSLSRPLASGAASALSAGWAPLATVLLAGSTLGFFAWYAILIPLHDPALLDAGLPAFVLLAAVGAIWAWTAYGAYFARRTGIKYDRALQYDAVSWIAYVFLWLSFVLPLTLTHGSGLLVALTGIFALCKLLVAARFNQTVRDVLVDFSTTRFAIIVIAELAAVIIGQRAGQHVQESRNLLLAVWGRWDAVHYLSIATVGYHGIDMAFFPLFPVLIAIVGRLVGNHLIAGLAISNSAFFFGLLFLYKLVEHEFDRNVARRAIFYVSIFPTAIFFSAVYTESLFFMLAVASFYYLREHKWWLAGFIGFFAALTRAEGVLLAIPFLIEWYAAHRSHPLRALPQLAAAAPIPLGLAVYMGYLWVLNGDPLYFSHVQAHWHRHLAMPWTSVVNSVRLIATATNPQTIANQSLELAFTALMIGVLLAGWHRLRPSYVAWMALSILVPMSTSSLMSMQRFALVLFPMFAILALWGKRPAVNNLIVALSLPLLGLFTVLFANWYWVA